MHSISKELGRHYSEKFSLHGTSSAGVGWGTDESKALLRYEKMLQVASGASAKRPSMLDVGCGYGALYQQWMEKREADLPGIEEILGDLQYMNKLCTP